MKRVVLISMLSIMGVALQGASAPQYSITYHVNYCDDLKVVVNREAYKQPLFSPSLVKTNYYYLSLPKRPRHTNIVTVLNQMSFLPPEEIGLKVPQRKRSIMQKKEYKQMLMDVKPSSIQVKVPP